MTQSDLDAEYAPKAAQKARARAAQQRRIINQGKAIDAEPIDQEQQLSNAVAQLAAAWGLKKKS